MKTTSQTYRSIIVIVSLLLIYAMVGSLSAQPTVELLIAPNIETIRIGEIQEVIITARTTEQGLRFAWELDGPGYFEGDTETPAIFYIPPASLEGESAEVTITVTVTDDKNRTVAQKVTFTLLAPTATMPPVKKLLPAPIPGQIPIQINKVLLEENDGTIINPTYAVGSGGTVTIRVDVTKPPEKHLEIDCTAIFGTVEFRQREILYTAPKKPGGGDIVTVRVLDNTTDEILIQEIINITIRDK